MANGASPIEFRTPTRTVAGAGGAVEAAPAGALSADRAGAAAATPAVGLTGPAGGAPPPAAGPQARPQTSRRLAVASARLGRLGSREDKGSSIRADRRGSVTDSSIRADLLRYAQSVAGERRLCRQRCCRPGRTT